MNPLQGDEDNYSTKRNSFKTIDHNLSGITSLSCLTNGLKQMPYSLTVKISKIFKNNFIFFFKVG